jgi:hypothetical protein
MIPWKFYLGLAMIWVNCALMIYMVVMGWYQFAINDNHAYAASMWSLAALYFLLTKDKP